MHILAVIEHATRRIRIPGATAHPTASWLARLHHPGAQDHPQELEQGLVGHAFLDRLHQLLFRNRLETAGDIRLHHPPPTPRSLIDDDLQGVVLPALRAEPEAARQEVVWGAITRPSPRPGHSLDMPGDCVLSLNAFNLRSTNPERV
jgi:hypothetical protein